jgi:uncharacterized phage protein (TIGR02218 family)
MRTQVADWNYRVTCIRMECTNGIIERLTDHPTALTMSNGNVYSPAAGHTFTANNQTSNFSSSLLDLTGIAGFSEVNLDSIRSGIFDNARLYIFYTTWNNPVEDYEPVSLNFLGKVKLEDDKYTVEVMGSTDALNQSVGRTYTPQCYKRFGSTGFAGCFKTPTQEDADITVIYSRYDIEATISAPAGTYDNGLLEFVSGTNTMLQPMVIKKHLTNRIILHEPMYYNPEIGDTVQLTEGCVKTQAACITKSNILNFGGFPSIPVNSTYIARGTKQ